MREILLFGNKGVVLVDDTDLLLLDKHVWSLDKRPRTSYAQTKIDGKTVRIHSLIMDTSESTPIDHRDGDGLNNQRYNLRLCTPTQNQHNKRKWLKKTTSVYKGVYWCKTKNRWRVAITVDGKRIRLGRYKNEKEAGTVYNEAAREHFGEYALLNVI